MNKIKYGDTVTITDGEFKGKSGTLASKGNYTVCTVCTNDGMVVLPISDVAPYSPVADMLSIPDDHVWPVEWRKINPPDMIPEQSAIRNESNNIAYVPLKLSFLGAMLLDHGYTHYLTEADLLKLPFQK